MKTKLPELWRMSQRKEGGVAPPDDWLRNYKRNYKCWECGMPNDPVEPIGGPIPLIDPEPRRPMSYISLTASLWRQDLFDEVERYLPPIVRWPYQPQGKPWKHQWVVFYIDPAHHIRDHWEGYEYTQCAKCGLWSNCGFLSGKTPWYKAEDLVFGISQGVMGGILVTREVRDLPVWKEVKDISFTKVGVRA